MTGAPDLLRVGVESGESLVARFGDTVVLVAGEDDDQTGHLLDAVGAAASDLTAGGIAGGLARWIADRPADDPTAFGLVTPISDGVVVFLRGDVWCEVVHDGAPMTLTGKNAATWADRIVPEPVDRVSVGLGPARPLHVPRRSDLSSGIVPGGAFVREPARPGTSSGTTSDGAGSDAVVSTPVAPPVQAPDVAPIAPPDAAPVARPDAAPVSAPVAAPETSRAAAPTAAEPAGTPIEDPARTVETAAPAPPARQLVREPARDTVRPPARETATASVPIGVLRCADGPTLPLDRSYVVGRDPQNDPSVRAGRATPITVSDPTNLISRVHAFVSVDDGVVVVRDGSTVSGTYLAEPGAEGWTRLSTKPTEIPPGWHLRIGTKVFVFEPTLQPAS